MSRGDALRSVTASHVTLWRAALALAFAFLMSGCGAAFGARPKGAQLVAVERSPNYAGGKFRNTEPMYTNTWKGIGSMLAGARNRVPKAAVPVAKLAATDFSSSADSGLRITWLGHSTTLVEVDGRKFLTDPVWGKRTSPYGWIGPKRWYPPPLRLEDLPQLDAVLISHDHYDHLDYPTIERLRDSSVRFVVPLGVDAHLVHWGISEDRIDALDWWDEVQIGRVQVVLVPSRHASGRGVFHMNETLWGGYAIIGPQHRVYFSGDTGMFSGLAEIGRRYGPFDFTMIEVGAYNQAWPDWHMGPEQAVLAHRIVRGKFFLPIHWGLFNLSAHAWTEPLERVLAAAHQQGVSVATPRPGQSIDGSTVATTERWWPQVPWTTASEDPIIATTSGDKNQRFDLRKLEESLPDPIKPDLSVYRQ